LDIKPISTTVKQAVRGGFKDRAKENVQVTGAKLKEILGSYKKTIGSLIDAKL